MLQGGYRIPILLSKCDKSKVAFTLWERRPELPARAILGRCEYLGRADGPMQRVVVMAQERLVSKNNRG